MKPIDKPQFAHLCETMSNLHPYHVAIGSLAKASHKLAIMAKSVAKTTDGTHIRWSPDDLLDAISETEMNIELIKRRYIYDMMDEYEKRQSKNLSELYRQYSIKEE